MKKTGKKFLAAFCALALFFNGIGIDVLFGKNGASEVQAADEYEKVTLSDFGIPEGEKLPDTLISGFVSGTVPLATIEGKTLHNKEVSFVFNQKEISANCFCLRTGSEKYKIEMYIYANADSNGNAVSFERYGSGIATISKTELDEAGLNLMSNDTIVTLQYSMSNPDASTTNVTLIFTLTDAADSTKTYTKTVVYEDMSVADLALGMDGYFYSYGYVESVREEQKIKYEKVTLSDFEIPEGEKLPDTLISGFVSGTVQLATIAGKTLHNKEVSFIFNLKEISNNFLCLRLGSEKNKIDMYIQASQDANGNSVEFGKYGAAIETIAKTELDAAGLNLLSNNTKLTMQTTLADPDASTTDVTMIFILTDVTDSTKTYSKTIVFEDMSVADLALGMDGYFLSYGYVESVIEQQEIEYEKVTLSDFSIPEGEKQPDTLISGFVSGTVQLATIAGKTLHNKEVSFIFNLKEISNNFLCLRLGSEKNKIDMYIQASQDANGNSVEFGKYGAAIETIAKTELDAAGLNLLSNNTKLTIRTTLADPDASTTDVTMIFILTDVADNTKTYSKTVVFEDMSVADLALGMDGYFLSYGYVESVTDKPEITYEVLDLSDFGVTDDIEIGEWTDTEQGNTHTAGEGTLHGVEVVGRYKFDSTTFDNGWGTTNYTRVYFGGESENFYMECRPVQQYLGFGYDNGSGDQKLSDTVRITKEDAEAVNLSLFDTELLMSAKFVCSNPSEENSKVFIIITLNDPSDPEKKVTREMTLTNFPMSGMSRVIRVAQNYSGRMTYAPLVPVVTGPITYEKLGLDAFGIGYGTQISGWYEEQGTTYEGGEGTLHATEIVGNYELDTNEFDNGWGTTNYAKVYFGEVTDNFFVKFSPVHKNIQFGYQTDGNSIGLSDEFNITQADMEEGGVNFFNSLTTMSVKFACRKPTAEFSDVKVTVTLSNPKDSSKSVSRELTLADFPVAGLKRNLTVAQAFDCRFKYEPLEVVVEDYKGEIEQLDIGHFGVEDSGSVSGWTTEEQQQVFAELNGTLHATEVIGNFKFDATKFDNGWGTTNYTRIYYGGAGAGFYVEYRPVQEYLGFGYIDENGNEVSINKTYNITKTDLEAIGLKLTGEQLTMKVKFICSTPDKKMSDIKVTVSICDTKDDSKSISREITIADFPMSNMNRVLTLAQNYNGIMEFGPKNYVVTGNKVNFRRFGFTENWERELELK